MKNCKLPLCNERANCQSLTLVIFPEDCRLFEVYCIFPHQSANTSIEGKPDKTYYVARIKDEQQQIYH